MYLGAIASSRQSFLSNFFQRNENQLAKLAIATLAVSVLALGSVGVASAAKSGGRIGGQAFWSSAPRPRRLHLELTTDRERTNIYVNPPVAPPLIGGYGYGCGGWGLSPFSFFAPGPAVAVGVGGGFNPSFSSCFLEPLQP
ncbi:hypothetical protein BRARA_J01157 [Brassica rapa]|uniref:Uncharacterized protein n=1 Tax=Brassica campestris TaxID=3711 RepID=A0A397XJV4_BRACM|nr:hypothetical protein BRARA_J01157 [Brassica rapa]